MHDIEVSIVLCDDEFIQELNQTYRNKNKPTDVLSFSMKEGECLSGDTRILGDIIISVETACRQGTGIGHSPLEEVTSLMIHGLLHLLGYDHQTRHDEKFMSAESRKLENLFF
jgi:probable rRNA maturation factor